MTSWLILLFIPAAAYSGWRLATHKEKKEARLSKTKNAYLEGLGFLLNDQTDRAVDAFLSMDDLDSQAVENQLALGVLFRKRGEPDRALHLHKRLSQITNLEEKLKLSIDYEMAEDFRAAGMYQEAQQIFESLSGKNFQVQKIFSSLWHLYEISHNWEKAITVNQRFLAFAKSKEEEKIIKNRIAHYYCEIAEGLIFNKKTGEAEKYLKEALKADNSCIRAYALEAKLATDRGEDINALHQYHSLCSQDADFAADFLKNMEDIYQKSQRGEEFYQWLFALENRTKQTHLTLAVAEIIAREDKKEAWEFLDRRLREQNNPLLLSAYLHYQENSGINEKIQKSIAPKTAYQCKECGFKIQKIIWHCPACYSWSSFRPFVELRHIEK